MPAQDEEEEEEEELDEDVDSDDEDLPDPSSSKFFVQEIRVHGLPEGKGIPTKVPPALIWLHLHAADRSICMLPSPAALPHHLIICDAPIHGTHRMGLDHSA